MTAPYTMDLRERVGEGGSVTALEPAEYYLDYLDSQAKAKGWTNITCTQGTAETALLPTGTYDLIFVRWVIGFVPNAEGFIANLVPSLKNGGIIAIQDYLYSGLGLYPKGGAFDNALETVIRHWGAGGGDAFIASKRFMLSIRAFLANDAVGLKTRFSTRTDSIAALMQNSPI